MCVLLASLVFSYFMYLLYILYMFVTRRNFGWFRTFMRERSGLTRGLPIDIVCMMLLCTSSVPTLYVFSNEKNQDTISYIGFRQVIRAHITCLCFRLRKYKTQTGYMSPYYLSKAYITNFHTAIPWVHITCVKPK